MQSTFEVESSALPHGSRVVGLRGSERISSPYVFDIYVNVVGSSELDLDEAPGSRISIRLYPGTLDSRTYNGIIAAVELVQAVEGNVLYLVRLVPNLWYLAQTLHSRVFTEQSIPEVIEAVLAEEGIDAYEMRLTRGYTPESHVCQYQESSLAFIHRWMEREGLYYFFEQEDGEEKLIITDDKGSHAPSRLQAIPYYPSGGSAKGAHLDRFSTKSAALPALVRLRDYDYAKPSLDVSGRAPVSDGGVGEQVLHAGRFFSANHGAHLATVRAEGLRADAKLVQASGPVYGIAAGYTFSISEHSVLAVNGEYVAVTVEHYGFIAELASSWGNVIPHHYDEVYRVELTAIRADQQYRSLATTPWPRAYGYENAVIDGPASSEYAQIDSLGRYAIKFKFDEGTLRDGKASTWVRKMEPHAGSTEGFHFPERKNTEVICAFLGGDPDRPIIIGAVPNAVTPSPVTAGNHMTNVIQTGGSNRLELEDQAGAQRITMSTPTCSTQLIMGAPVGGFEATLTTSANALLNTGVNTNFTIGNNWTVDVTTNIEENVGACVTENYMGPFITNVTNNVTQNYSASYVINVTTDKTETVLGPVTHTYIGDLSTLVTANVTSIYTGNNTAMVFGTQTELVLGDLTETFTATRTTTVSGDVTQTYNANLTTTIAGTKDETVTGDRKQKVLGFIEWDVQGPQTWKVNGGFAADFFVGAKTDVFVGGKASATLAVDLSAFVGAKVDFELAGKKSFGPSKKEAHATTTVACVSNSQIAASYKIKAIQTDIKAVRVHVMSAHFRSKAALTEL